jgi:transposase InsO family protein
MNRLLQVLSLSTFGITLCLNPFNTIAFGSRAIAAEKSIPTHSLNTSESQQFSTDPKSHPEVIHPAPNWAAQSLKELAERYECAPNGLFQRDRATTRYELAATLNACHRHINNRFATQQDREIAQKLKQEFQLELTAIQQRTKDLEARAATLDSQQFSPTSKLQGQTVITIQGGGF